MSRRDDALRLQDMLAAARDARAFTAGKAENDLQRDKQLTLALLKCVEIIGEAAACVGEDTRAKFSDLPWGEMIGMRNRLVHAYFDIDLSLLWATVTNDLPLLIRDPERIVSDKPA
ncbi:MAG: DUF86 domain-containing protein [Planctomycetota bacterium]